MKVIEKEKYIKYEDLEKDSEVVHLYTKKPFNLDTYSNYMYTQYKALEEMANFKFDKIVVSHQSHSNNICVVSSNTEDIVEDNDGLITNERKIAILTVSADCQNVILYDPVNKVIGNIHSGWKGTLNRILNNAINIMITEFSCNPKNIKAYFSPSILKCCFEVDEELINSFKMVFDDIDDLIIKGDIVNSKQKYFLDTMTLNKRELIKYGLKEENIFVSDICTKCNSDKYNSYRSDKKSGRNVSLVCLK